MDTRPVDTDADQGRGRRWMLRPIIWFATAYTLVIIVHEAAHAFVAVALGHPSTLFNFWVNHQFGQATAGERAISGVAGPVASLLFGLACAVLYRRRPHPSAALPLLYLAAFGVSNFLGNLMSAAFIGDFSAAAVRLGVPQGARVAAALAGAVGVAGTFFATGRALWYAAPRQVSRGESVMGLIVVPAVVGTAIVIAVNQPTPMGASFATARVSESAFWSFAVLGVLTTRQSRREAAGTFRFTWADGLVALFVVLAVRVMAQGIAISAGGS